MEWGPRRASEDTVKATGKKNAQIGKLGPTPNGDRCRAIAPGASESLTDRIYLALKKDIIRGVFSPGDVLSERALTERYHGSRTPVREAAFRLQEEHLLRIIPNRGYFVSQITINWMVCLYEFRAAVEGAAAELAARKWADPLVVEKLATFGAAEFDAHDRPAYERFIRADTEFHVGIARLSRNPLLVRAVADTRSHMERIMYAAIDINYYGESPVREHAAIIAAIEKRDAAKARELMVKHITGSWDKALRLTATNADLP